MQVLTLYHQLGWRFQWSLKSLQDDSAGDAVIVGPRYMSPEKVSEIDQGILNRSLFDPQFFVPQSRQGELPNWEFFPETISDGFASDEFGAAAATEASRLCLRYQAGLGFRGVVSPTRFMDCSIERFIDSQAELFVEPFLSAYRAESCSQPLFVQLILTGNQLKDQEFRSRVLNWVTGIDEVAGVYLIPQDSRRRKQVHDVEYLVSLMLFVHALRRNDMEVVVGYLNTEGIPLLLADPSGVSMGSYENLRNFSLRAFENEEPDQMRGPTARVYVSRLLQWVSHEYLGAISSAVDDADDFFDQSQHQVSMFEPSYNWHFSRPHPYMHFFVAYSKQVNRLAAVPASERHLALDEELKRASEEYRKLDDAGVIFDADSGGDHIPLWRTAMNTFNRTRDDAAAF